jgi:ParB family chromosome partitioning protein
LQPLQQRDIAQQVVSKSLSVRQTESLVRRLLEDKSEDTSKTLKVSSDIQKLEEDLGQKIGVPVTVQHNAKGRGRLILKYNSLDELDGILKHMNYEA